MFTTINISSHLFRVGRITQPHLCSVRRLLTTMALFLCSCAFALVTLAANTEVGRAALGNPRVVGQDSTSSTHIEQLEPKVMCQTNGEVKDLLYSRDVLFVAGIFSEVRPAGEPLTSTLTVPRNGLAACNTTTGEILPWDPQVTHTDLELFTINAMILSGDEQILFIGGNFRAVGGSPRVNAAAIDLYTGEPTEWAPSTTGPVHDFALSWDGLTLYRAGGFGVDAYQVARSGTKVDTFAPLLQKADDSSSSARSVALSYDSTTLYIGGGEFQKVNGEPRHGAAAVDAATGTITQPFNPDIVDINVDLGDTIAQVYDIRIHNNMIYLCGDWWITEGSGDSQRQRNVNRFDPVTGEADRAWWPWTDGGINSCYLDSHNNALIIGGYFDKVGGTNDDYENAPFTRDFAAISLAGGNLLPWNLDTRHIDPSIEGDANINIKVVVAVAGHAFVGGTFTAIEGTPQQGVASLQNGPTALFVVGDENSLIDGDYVLRKRLEINHNIAVDLVSHTTAVGADADEVNLVLISGSIAQTPALPNAREQFKSLSIPMIVWVPWLFDNFGMTAGQSATEMGTTQTVRNITIIDPDHPLAAGLAGEVLITNRASQLAWGNVGAGADIVATVFEPAGSEHDGGDRAVLFGYPANAQLPDGTLAAGCRIGIPNYRAASESYTSTGWTIFDSAIRWGLDCPSASSTPTNTPTIVPTGTPTTIPTDTPTSTLTATPTDTPTLIPTLTPTSVPPTKTPTVTPTPVTPIPALSIECRDITPPGVQRAEVCVTGLVFVGGLPADNVTVTIRDQNGDEIETAVTQTHRFPFGENRAYYRAVLGDLRFGDSFMVEADVNGQIVASSEVSAAASVQQVDLIFSGDDSSRPFATIRHVDHLMIQGEDPLIADGVGQSAMPATEIIAWRWESDRDGLLGESPTLNVPNEQLVHGTHQLSFSVRDSSNSWSAPVTTQIDVLNDNHVEWTVLLYLAGDYDDGGTLNRKFVKAMRRISQTLNTPSVRVAAYVDGPESDDTVSYLIDPSQVGPNRVNGPTRIDEKAMDTPETLTEFINWGTTQFPAEHTYLVIANHGQALRGIAWDHTSDLADGEADLSEYLTVAEVATAIENSAIQTVDILHFDACTMNLLEGAYEIRNQADMMISSQYYGWDFFAYEFYADLFNSLDTPHTISHRVTREYANLAQRNNLPFTISALDLNQVEPTATKLNALGEYLVQAIDGGNLQLKADLQGIRPAVQTFDSNDDRVNTSSDVYIDLTDWLEKLVARVPDPEVEQLVTDLREAMIPDTQFANSPLILNSESSSNELLALPGRGAITPNLVNANGLSIFYPANAEQRYSEYVGGEIFTFTTEHPAWRDLIENTFDILPEGQASIEVLSPHEVLNQEQAVFLPMIVVGGQ